MGATRNAVVTTHHLDFEAFCGKMFRVGTCHGIWGVDTGSYLIIAVCNDAPNNGQLIDVFEWFEHACRRDNMSLRIVEELNSRFYNHLITKRGFTPVAGESRSVVKHFHKQASINPKNT
jgi:hypothetical protein